METELKDVKEMKKEEKETKINVSLDPNEPKPKTPLISVSLMLSYEWIFIILAFLFSLASGSMPIIFYRFFGDMIDEVSCLIFNKF